MNQKIKNLIFDVGGVIILNKKINFLKFDKKFALPEGTVERIVMSCFRGKTADKNFNENLFFQKNFSSTLSWKNYQEIFKEIFESEKVNKSLLNWIKKRKKDCKIHLLTNNTAALNRLLKEKFKIDDLFDSVFNSAEIGLAKPDSKFFKYLLKTIKADSKECLFVDDKIENINTARELGFTAILFESNKKFFKEMKEFKI